MVNPVFRNGDATLQAPLPIHAAPISRGLADVPSTIDQASAPATLVQRFRNCLQRIYDALVDVLKSVLCRFCSKKMPSELADFNNSGVVGEINGIYITTNETNLENTRQLLGNHPRPAQETIHVGCATWHNLDIICARKSTYGLILDFNPKNAEFIRKTIELIGTCESRDAFKTAMIHYLDSLTGSERGLYFHADQRGLPTDRIERELSRAGSWLQSEENYLFVKRELISKGRLVPITEDIRNFGNFSKIRDFLDRNNIVVDTLYMSNICNFMQTPDEKSSYEKSVKALLNNDTIFISCPTLLRPNPLILSQKAVLGREVLEGNPMRLFFS